MNCVISYAFRKHQNSQHWDSPLPGHHHCHLPFKVTFLQRRSVTCSKKCMHVSLKMCDVVESSSTLLATTLVKFDDYYYYSSNDNTAAYNWLFYYGSTLARMITTPEIWTIYLPKLILQITQRKRKSLYYSVLQQLFTMLRGWWQLENSSSFAQRSYKWQHFTYIIIIICLGNTHMFIRYVSLTLLRNKLAPHHPPPAIIVPTFLAPYSSLWRVENNLKNYFFNLIFPSVSR